MLLPEERLQAPDSPQSTPQTVTGGEGCFCRQSRRTAEKTMRCVVKRHPGVALQSLCLTKWGMLRGGCLGLLWTMVSRHTHRYAEISLPYVTYDRHTLILPQSIIIDMETPWSEMSLFYLWSSRVFYQSVGGGQPHGMPWWLVRWDQSRWPGKGHRADSRGISCHLFFFFLLYSFFFFWEVDTCLSVEEITPEVLRECFPSHNPWRWDACRSWRVGSTCWPFLIKPSVLGLSLEQPLATASFQCKTC